MSAATYVLPFMEILGTRNQDYLLAGRNAAAIVKHHTYRMLRALILFLTVAGALTLQAADEAMPASHINSGGASVEVTFAPGKVNLPQSTVLSWIKSAADSVSAYYGRFPVPHARILVRPVEG